MFTLKSEPHWSSGLWWVISAGNQIATLITLSCVELNEWGSPLKGGLSLSNANVQEAIPACFPRRSVVWDLGLPWERWQDSHYHVPLPTVDSCQ